MKTEILGQVCMSKGCHQRGEKRSEEAARERATDEMSPYKRDSCSLKRRVSLKMRKKEKSKGFNYFKRRAFRKAKQRDLVYSPIEM